MAVLLLAYTSVRAYGLSLTHDEALTYQVVKGEGWSVAQTANHHVLNTKLMIVSASLFGTGELALRLPNLLGHALYLIFGMLLLKRLRNPGILLAAFVLFHCNPFILDFFSLARGYGLALGLLIAALYFVLRAWETTGPVKRIHLIWLIAAAVCGYLAMWANFTVINMNAGIFLLLLARLLYDGTGFRFNRRTVLLSAAFIVLFMVSFIPVAKDILRLKANNELYFGGNTGFVHDTVHSLFQKSAYTSQPLPAVVQTVLTIVAGLLFFASLFFCVRRLRKKETLSLADLSLFSLLFSVLVILVQHYAADVLFAIERTALAYIPLFVLTITASFDREIMQERARVANVLFSALAFAGALHFARCINFTHVLAWQYDAHTKTVMQKISTEVKADPSRAYRVGATSLFGPAMEYYRDRFGLNGTLDIAVRDRFGEAENDFLYITPDDLPLVDEEKFTGIENDALSGGALYRRK